MGQKAHSMPAIREGLRNNLWEQGRSSRARNPQLNGKSGCQFGSTGKWHREPTRLPGGQRAPRLLSTA